MAANNPLQGWQVDRTAIRTNGHDLEGEALTLLGHYHSLFSRAGGGAADGSLARAPGALIQEATRA
jgi:hypothetical protein